MMNQNNPFVVYVQLYKKREKRPKGASVPSPNALKTNEMLGLDITIIMAPNHVHAHAPPFFVQCKMREQTEYHPPTVPLECSISPEAASRIIRRRRSAVATSSRIGPALPFRTLHAIDTFASDGSRRVVVIEASRLKESHRDLVLEGTDIQELAGNDRTDDECQEDDEKHEVENGIADDPALAKLCLLQRVDWRADLTTTAS